MKSLTKIHPTTLYALEVIQGKRVTGHLEYLACKRHLDDLERQGSDNFPWIFDEEKANKVFEFFSYLRHIKGPLVNKPIELEPFQMFDLGCIFGWVHGDTGFRRFEKAFIEEGRKNGKSTEVGGVVLDLMVADKEEEPDVYCAAVDKGQARIVYNIAKKLALKSPDIRKRLIIRDYRITHATRGGILEPLSKDTENKDGLNPSGAVVDEYHAHKTSEIYDLIWSAKGQRNQFLMMTITTAGVDAEKSPCYQEYDLCKQILEKTNPNERYFVMIRELDQDDDEHDPKNWIKANPLRASTAKGLAELQEAHDEAFNSKIPSKIRTFRIKILNRWVYEGENSYMGDYLQKWDSLIINHEQGKMINPVEGRKDFLKLTKGWSCIAGVDISKQIDLTGVGFLFFTPGGKIAIWSQGFIPQPAVARHEKTDRVPYRDWVKDGWVTEIQSERIDIDVIEDYIRDLAKANEWKLLEICYDPYDATQFATDLKNGGFTCVEIRQGEKTLSEPTKTFRYMVATGDVIHDGNPAFKWCLGNAKEKVTRNGNSLLSKENKSDTQRIDLLAAIINAMVRLVTLRGSTPKDISAEILSEEWGM